ncbi:MAG: hypothetical protein KAS32_11170 [Candidatus Peribacteraceae bacterium]|nr:hypothetical protein [Candidatus Peribacteraceae bacterium]
MSIIQLTEQQLDQVAKTAAMMSRTSHEESMSRLYSEAKLRDKVIVEKLDGIKEQVEKTNGRVTGLEEKTNIQDKDIAVMSKQVDSHKKILWSGISAVMLAVLGAGLSLIL